MEKNVGLDMEIKWGIYLYVECYYSHLRISADFALASQHKKMDSLDF